MKRLRRRSDPFAAVDAYLRGWFEALLGGFADSTILRQHALRMIEHQFQPGGPARYQVKDTLPVLQVVDRLFRDMVDHGDGDLDHSAIIREIGRRNGLTIPASS